MALSRRSFLESLAAGACLATGGPAGAAPLAQRAGEKPAARRPKVTVSKKTTYVTGPLRPDGTVDFAAALNEMLGRGVTPENNAVVPLMRAFGPKEIEAPIRPRYFKALGMEELPEEGDYLVAFSDTLMERDPTDEERTELYDQLDCTTRQPWKAKQFPVLDDWIEVNQRPSMLLSQAARRTRCFWPVVRDEDTSLLSACLLKCLGTARNAVRLLTARAMRSTGARDFERAWEDLMSVRRLARLYSHGGFLLDLLIGRACEYLASQAIASLLHEADWPIERVRRTRAELDGLPPLAPLSDIWNRPERVFGIGYMLEVAAGEEKYLNGTSEHTMREQLTKRLLVDPRVDWDETLELLNESFDQRVAILRMPHGPQREAAVAKRRAEIEEIVRGLGDLATLERRSGKTPDGRRLLSLYLCYGEFADGSLADDKLEHIALTRLELNRLTPALAAFRAEKRQYPEKLAELVPSYLPAVPRDPFSGQAMKYRREGAGYVLYSVGVNRRDDGGRNTELPEEAGKWDDEPDASKCPDDIVIRVPYGAKPPAAAVG